jgi:predicted nucleic-acid-binding Zn-ribbon protein
VLKRHVCPKCEHNHILWVSNVPDKDDHGIRPAHIATVFVRTTAILKIDEYTAVGTLSAAVCRACGYTELYTRNPESIPIDGKSVTELVGPEPAGPFR